MITASQLRNREPSERAFLLRWSTINGAPELVSQHRFHPTRKWLFDFADLPSKVAIEIDGGQWRGKKGGHTSGAGMARDREKDFEAVMLGWTVIRLTTEMAKDRKILERIVDLLRW